MSLLLQSRKAHFKRLNNSTAFVNSLFSFLKFFCTLLTVLLIAETNLGAIRKNMYLELRQIWLSSMQRWKFLFFQGLQRLTGSRASTRELNPPSQEKHIASPLSNMGGFPLKLKSRHSKLSNLNDMKNTKTARLNSLLAC
jgi:hypothetical protein